MSPSKVFGRIALIVCGIMLISTIVQFIIGFVSEFFFDFSGSIPYGVLLAMATIAMYFIAFPIGIAMMKKIPSESIEEEKLGVGQFIKFIIMCIPILYVGNILGILLASVLSGGTAENPLQSLLTDDSIISNFFITIVVAPIIEEWFFRKVIIDKCSRYGEKTAIFFSALMFALFHFNLYQLLYTFGWGLVWAYVYTRTRRLRYPVLMHMIINFIGSVPATLITNAIGTDIVNELTAGTADEATIMAVLPLLLAYLAFFAVMLVLCIVGMVLIFKNRKKLTFVSKDEEIPRGEIFETVYLNAGFIIFVVAWLLIAIVPMFVRY